MHASAPAAPTKEEKKTEPGAAAPAEPAKPALVEPPPFEFISEQPPVSAQDMYAVRVLARLAESSALVLAPSSFSPALTRALTRALVLTRPRPLAHRFVAPCTGT